MKTEAGKGTGSNNPGVNIFLPPSCPASLPASFPPFLGKKKAFLGFCIEDHLDRGNQRQTLVRGEYKGEVGIVVSRNKGKKPTPQ